MRGQDYFRHLSLYANPFPVVPDVSNYYLPKHLNTVLSEIEHVIQARKGFAIVTGEVGLGKTTMSRVLMGILQKKEVSIALILNTLAQGEMLLSEINKDFGLEVDQATFSQKMDTLNTHLQRCYGEGINCVIVIDEAQNLSVESLELVRLISNLETESHKLVQVLLIGQPELRATLGMYELRQLKSRVAYQAEIRPYSLEETKHYIHFKLNAAGNKGGVSVPDTVIEVVQRISAGNPRLINLLMDRYLYALVAYGCQSLDAKEVKNMALDAGLDVSSESFRYWKVLTITPMLLILVSWIFFRVESVNVEESPANNVVVEKPTFLPKAIEKTVKKDTSMKVSSVVSDAMLESFLDAYGLKKKGLYFLEAIQADLEGDWLDRLNALSDWQVVVLPLPLEDILASHATYALSSMPNQPYMLLWKPEIKLSEFYFGYYSEGVKQLQQQLLDLGFYNHKPDGVVGTRTIAALAHFQLEQHLKPTGRPDDTSLFLLSYRQHAKTQLDSAKQSFYFMGQHELNLLQVNGKRVVYG